MATFTPSSTSSFIAGLGFWALVWSIVLKIDRATGYFKWRTSFAKAILAFVREEKLLSLSMTEVINYSIHGITNPLSVMFALGGTVFNVFMIFVAIPFGGLFAVKQPLEARKVRKAS